MNWNLISITPLHFLNLLTGMGIIFENDKLGNRKKVDEKSLAKIRKLTYQLADLSV